MGNTIDIFRVRAHENRAEFVQLLPACQTESRPKTGQHGPCRTGHSLGRPRRYETIVHLFTGEFDETNPDARNQPHLQGSRNEPNAPKACLLQQIRLTPAPRHVSTPTPYPI
jgi:hypothetical protein